MSGIEIEYLPIEAEKRKENIRPITKISQNAILNRLPILFSANACCFLCSNFSSSGAPTVHDFSIFTRADFPKQARIALLDCQAKIFFCFYMKERHILSMFKRICLICCFFSEKRNSVAIITILHIRVLPPWFWLLAPV